MKRILLTCPPMINRIKEYETILREKGFEITIPEFKQVMTEYSLCRIIADYDGWIIGDDPATRKVFETGHAGKLNACIKWGVGTDNVDFDACKSLNIPITNIPQVFGEEVSDIAIGYLLCLTRRLHIINDGHRTGEWLKPLGETLVGKKLCLIGFGDIGRCIARKLLAFKLDIWISDPAFSKSLDRDNNNRIIHDLKYGNINISNRELDREYGLCKFANINECLEECDYVICCCPLNKHTFHLVRRENILLCKKGVKIVNVGRGPVIKEDDICELLDSGHIDSVGFDVFETEPLILDNPLTKYKQNILGSHNGSNTTEAVDKVSKIAIDTLHTYFTQLEIRK